MNKELLVKIWIIALLVSAGLFIFVTISSNWAMDYTLGLITLVYAIILFSSIPLSIIGNRKKIRFSVFLMLLGMLLLLFSAPFMLLFLNPPDRLISKNVAVIDYSCINGTTAQAIIRNAGTDTLNLGACTAAGSVGGGASVVHICEDMTITKTAGGNMNGQLDKTSIAIGQDTIFTDPCPAGTTCTYRFVTSGVGIGPNPNIAIVEC